MTDTYSKKCIKDSMAFTKHFTLAIAAGTLIVACTQNSISPITKGIPDSAVATYRFDPSEKLIKSYMDYLASDDLLGRETGSIHDN